MTSNQQRSAETRGKLIKAARKLFATQGYAATGTPEITAAAGLSRGALYHHFTDKAGLFQAVIEQELDTLSDTVTANITPEGGVEAILTAGEAFLDAIQNSGVRQLLLIDGPAVLGEARMRELDTKQEIQALAEIILQEIAQGSLVPVPALATAEILVAAYERAALSDSAEYRTAIRELVLGLRKNA